MIRILDDEESISTAQQSFLKEIYNSFNQTITGTVNCLGGKFTDDLSYAESFDMWYFYQGDGKKHWNAFGLGKPSHKGLRIHSEINAPSSGINRAMAAAFAVNDAGHFYLLHRGKIRGGKELFFKYFTGQKVLAQDGDRQDEFALIASFSKGSVAKQTVDFVHQVILIKEQAKK